MPLVALVVVLPDHQTAHQQLQEHAVVGVEPYESGQKTPGQQTVEGPEAGCEVVKCVRNKTGVLPDGLAETHAAKIRKPLPPAGDCAAPRSALLCCDPTDDIRTHGSSRPQLSPRVLILPVGSPRPFHPRPMETTRCTIVLPASDDLK